jgi:hypothetical protein
MGGLATLNLNTLTLTSTLMEAPYNGAPSSQDYNDAWQEALVDLSTITGFINDTLIPILNALPATAANGLTGATTISDPSDQSALFFNAQSNQSLVVSDSMRVLLGQLNTLNTQLTDLGVQVTALQTQVGTTNQNGVIQTLQGLSQTVSTISTTLAQLGLTVTAQGVTLSKFQVMRVNTGPISPGHSATISLVWNSPYPTNSYTPIVTLLDSTGELYITSVSYSSSVGVGLTIIVTNGSDVPGAVTGTLCALAKGD